MNSPTYTLTFLLLTFLLGGMCIGIFLFWWEEAKEEKVNFESISLLLVALWLPGWLLTASLTYTAVLVENPRHCWDCVLTNEGYLVKEESKKKSLKDLFPMDYGSIDIEYNNARYYRSLYFDIILDNNKYSQPFNQCIFVAVTENFESIWGNLLLTTRFSQEEVEARIKLCRDALQE